MYSNYARSADFAVSIPPYHMMSTMSQLGQNYHYNAQHMSPLMGMGTTRPSFRPMVSRWKTEGRSLFSLQSKRSFLLMNVLS